MGDPIKYPELDKIYGFLEEKFPKGFVIVATYDNVREDGTPEFDVTYSAYSGNTDRAIGQIEKLKARILHEYLKPEVE